MPLGLNIKQYDHQHLNTPTLNLRITSRMSSKAKASHCYLEQENVHTLLSTSWFREWIQECVYKLIAFSTTELKLSLYKLTFKYYFKEHNKRST